MITTHVAEINFTLAKFARFGVKRKQTVIIYEIITLYDIFNY